MSVRLVGTFEVAQILGVSTQRVSQLAARPEFPEPLAHLRATCVWDEDEIVGYAESRPSPAERVAMGSPR